MPVTRVAAQILFAALAIVSIILRPTCARAQTPLGIGVQPNSSIMPVEMGFIDFAN